MVAARCLVSAIFSAKHQVADIFNENRTAQFVESVIYVAHSLFLWARHPPSLLITQITQTMTQPKLEPLALAQQV